ncbi:MAG: HAMP domain-containing protein [Candidatus Eisenbacteria bacterium]
MTLKLRLTAMMGFLLLAVIALQFLLAERERRSMEDRLSRLGSEVSRGTQSVLERVRDISWTLCDTLNGSTGTPPRVAMFTATHAPGESVRVQVSTSSADGKAATPRNEATRVLVKRVEPHADGERVAPGSAVLMLEDTGIERDGKTFNRRMERRLPADSVEVVVQQLLGDLRSDSIPNFFMRLHAEDAQRRLSGSDSSRTRTDVVVNLPLPLRGLDQMYAVEMRFPTNDLLAELERARRRSVAWLAALVSVGVVGAALMATQFTRPLRDLRASFRQVEQGDLSVALPLKRRDEIGQLTESFNHMVTRLREQRGVEERLAEAERMAAIGRMAAGVAHEVRNPLNAILLTLEQLREKSRGQDLIAITTSCRPRSRDSNAWCRHSWSWRGRASSNANGTTWPKDCARRSSCSDRRSSRRARAWRRRSRRRSCSRPIASACRTCGTTCWRTRRR